MESSKYFKVKATLELVGFGETSDRHGNLLEHRMFFVADQDSKEMKTTWTINDTSSYERTMLRMAISARILYKLSDLHTGLHFHFWLIVRQAEDYDCFYRQNQLKINTTYYIMNDSNTITGPLYIHEQDNPTHLKKLIEQNKVYVPTRKQLYEEYKKQHSA
jgi:hypothetical protein